MKHFYLIVLSILFSQLSFAGTITGSLNNGVWKNNSTWDKNRKPQNGDTIIIPAGKTIIVNDQQTLNNVYVKVLGTLKFNNALSYLSLNSTSGMIVQTGGKIQATIDFWQYIFLGGNTIFWADQLVGPLQTTLAGFSNFDPLPVKFVGFTAARKTTGDVLVQWSTSQEVNADHYEVERSYDGNEWTTAAYVLAVGNSSAVNNYSYTDKNLGSRTTYYRVKQVDQDGRISFTTIAAVKSETKGKEINIASVQGKVLLQFPQEIKGNVMVRFVNAAGQVIDQQTVKNVFGQVVLNSKVTGNYIISVSNGQDVNVAKQVIL